MGEIPIQEKTDDYNCGVYVLHYGYAIVRWYDRYRSNITPNRNNITVLDFLSNFCNSAILLTTNDGKEHMNNLRHQISALVCSLHKHQSINALHVECQVEKVCTFNTKLSKTPHRLIPYELIRNSPTTINKSMIRTRSSKKNNIPQSIKKFPDPHSFLVDKGLISKDLTNMFAKFIKKSMTPFKQFLHPIKPSTNNWRMNYQSQQAIRIFFAQTTHTSRRSATRYVYGPLAVLKSNGAHPSNDYRVHPFTDELSIIVDRLHSLMTNIGFPGTIFNFIEIKVYFGDNVFKDIDGELITDHNCNPVRLGCNKSVNAHNDLNFDDKGKQSAADTACSSEPTVTYTIGSTRKLIFEHMTKTETETSWTISNKKHNVIYQLEHGSVFVFLPDDDKPSEFRTDYPIIHKTKHKVDFNNDGISFAFVF